MYSKDRGRKKKYNQKTIKKCISEAGNLKDL